MNAQDELRLVLVQVQAAIQQGLQLVGETSTVHGEEDDDG